MKCRFDFMKNKQKICTIEAESRGQARRIAIQKGFDVSEVTDIVRKDAKTVYVYLEEHDFPHSGHRIEEILVFRSTEKAKERLIIKATAALEKNDNCYWINLSEYFSRTPSLKDNYQKATLELINKLFSDDEGLRRLTLYNGSEEECNSQDGKSDFYYTERVLYK